MATSLVMTKFVGDVEIRAQKVTLFRKKINLKKNNFIKGAFISMQSWYLFDRVYTNISFG